MLSFKVIGINDNPQPAFTDEVKEVIDGGKVFSGGLRHHEIVGDVLPVGSQWIDITVPLGDVFQQYRNVDGEIVVFASGDPLFFGFASTLQREFPDANIVADPCPSYRYALSRHDDSVAHRSSMECLRCRSDPRKDQDRCAYRPPAYSCRHCRKNVAIWVCGI